AIEPVKGDRRCTHPGNDREHLAHETAGESEDRRERDDRDDREVEGVHCAISLRVRRRGACRADRRVANSLKCPIASTFNPDSSARERPALGLRRSGIQAVPKPSLAASLRRASVWPTGRTSPERAISPKTTVSAGTGVSVNAETRAAATARSAAGSTIRSPPATLR